MVINIVHVVNKIVICTGGGFHMVLLRREHIPAGSFRVEKKGTHTAPGIPWHLCGRWPL